MPQFAPVRVTGGRYGLRRLVRTRQRALALGLAVTAAALVAAGPRTGGPAPARGQAVGDAHARAHSSAGAPSRGRRAAEKTTVPVRIADAGTVRLLRPGDRVDVIAVPVAATPSAASAFGRTATGGEARVVARGALVTKVPEPLDSSGSSVGADGGALLLLSVPRSTAARLAGASATDRLVVTLW
ncbi:hypothetical protein [Streptomyces sp. NPDC002588]|uniref:hypothetical protein n=1 Tax=Streptomyces sp. NPDC002588 TaxID=3154419 RepID=UPI0033259A1C